MSDQTAWYADATLTDFPSSFYNGKTPAMALQLSRALR